MLGVMPESQCIFTGTVASVVHGSLVRCSDNPIETSSNSSSCGLGYANSDGWPDTMREKKTRDRLELVTSHFKTVTTIFVSSSLTLILIGAKCI